MINLHVYPATMVNESRVEREVDMLGSLGYFSGVEVAGLSGPGLPTTQPMGRYGLVRRFAADADSSGLAAKAGKTAAFGRAVYAHYSRVPIAVINCHSLSALPLCVALKRATGARLVYDPHELETEAAAAVGVRKVVYKAAERALIRAVDHTFTVTESIEDWYRSAYGLTQIDTVYNLPSEEQVPSSVDKTYFRRVLGVPEGKVIYLYQGVLGRGRGIDTVLEAFDRGMVPNGAVVFLGYGPMEARIGKVAARSERAFLHPAVPPGELPNLTAAADVGLAPTVGSTCLSYRLSAPNKMFQYWRAGIPVIATRLPEHEKFMARYPAGVLMDEGDPSSLAGACQELQQTDAAALADALDRAASDLRWERYLDLYRSRYSRLVEGSGAG